MNSKPDARKESASILPGFQPMPKMVKVPILGHTARQQPIPAKEHIEGKVVDLCRGM